MLYEACSSVGSSLSEHQHRRRPIGKQNTVIHPKELGQGVYPCYGSARDRVQSIARNALCLRGSSTSFLVEGHAISKYDAVNLGNNILIYILSSRKGRWLSGTMKKTIFVIPGCLLNADPDSTTG